MSRKIVERCRRIERGVQIRVTGGGKEMRIGLIIHLDLGAVDVGQRTRETTGTRGDGALLMETRGGEMEEPTIGSRNFA